MERMENDMIAKKLYMGECVASRLVGQPRKRWIDSLKGCLKKIGMNVGQARRMGYDKNEWREFVRGNAWGIAWGMN